MRKAFLIGLKDLRLAFRDRGALILMLAAPFALTLGLGLVTGRFAASSSSSGLADIPVVIVNQDGGELGDALIELFESPDLAELLEPSRADDPATARALVDDDEAAAAILVPAGFSESILSPAASQVVAVELYQNPSRPTSSGVVRSILDSFLSQVELGRISALVTVDELVASGQVPPDQIGDAAGRVAQSAARAGLQDARITVRGDVDESIPEQFDPLAYMAPGMALMFLMFTVTNGGRTILSERLHGTLPRLLVAPVTMAQVLAGKATGIYLTGVAQMLILIGSTSLLFGIQWGSWPGVLILVLAAVFGALGWGLLLTVLSKTPGQVMNIGSAMMLVFGILGGSFYDTTALPGPLQAAAYITPNRWALDGFVNLAFVNDLSDLWLPVLALIAMGLLLFGLTVFLFLRRGGFER